VLILLTFTRVNKFTFGIRAQRKIALGYFFYTAGLKIQPGSIILGESNDPKIGSVTLRGNIRIPQN
jgi:hypothetical protein